MPHKSPIKITIINPNSNPAMTTALRAPIESLNYSDTEYTYYTAPSPSPYSINNSSDARISAATFLGHQDDPSQLPANPSSPLPSSSSLFRSDIDAILVACFSPHPLVPQLGRKYRDLGKEAPPVVVTGIFEASIQAAVSLLYIPEKKKEKGAEKALPALPHEQEGPPLYNEVDEEEEEEEEGGDGGGGGKGERFGIVTTGNAWGPILRDAVVNDVLGPEQAGRLFAGVECCGLDAGELHEEGEGGGVERRVKGAVERLIEGGENVGVVILGCAGMAGMEEWVREVAPRNLRVVDGVKAGVGVLQGLVRGGF